MTMRTVWAFGFCCALLATFAVAQPPPPADPDPAMNHPDMIAWQLFLQVNADAKTAGNNNALFETWANDGDTFNPSPKWPGPGEATKAFHPPVLTNLLRERAEMPPHGPIAQVVPPKPGSDPAVDGVEEVRRNHASFQFIVDNNLYKVSGLQKAFNTDIVFPTDSIEVKANWYPVVDPKDPTKTAIPGFDGTPAEALKVYHVNTTSDGKQYALVSMHIISKMVPNWTWATFEHRNNLGRCDVLGCNDSFGAVNAHVAPNADIQKGYPSCAKSPALAALFKAAKIDPAFANYCLKGTQVDFTDQAGLATRLGNSITEATFLEQSSCMTCHGKAAFNAEGLVTTFAGFSATAFQGFDKAGNPQLGDAPIGALRAEWFWNAGAGTQTYAKPPINGQTTQNPPHDPMYRDAGALPPPQRWAQGADFVWSIPFCAIDDLHGQTKSSCAAK